MGIENILRPHRILFGALILLAGGMAYGVYSRAADQPQANDTSRRDVVTELGDVGHAIGRLNQSYVIPPVISHRAATGGSYFIDTEDSAGVAMAPPAADTSDAAEATESPQKIKLPPPLYLSCHCGHLPCWLQGGVGWLYGEVSKPTCVEIPRPVIVRPHRSCGCPGPCNHPQHPHPGCGCPGPCNHHPHVGLGCGCPSPCQHHPSHSTPTPHSAPATQSDASDSDQEPLVAPHQDLAIPNQDESSPNQPPVAVPPSVLKRSTEPAPGDQQQLREELNRLREEVERLQNQLNHERQASLRDMDA